MTQKPPQQDAFVNPIAQNQSVEQSLAPMIRSLTSLRAHTSQRWLYNLFTLPFGGLLLVIGLLYTTVDLYQTTKNKLRYATTVSTLIAQTASDQQTTLVQSQIDSAIASMPFIDNIVFYPITLPQAMQVKSNDTPFNFTTVFLENKLSITRPVLIANYRDPQSKQLIGYINTTLNLKKSREIWLTNNFPMMAVVFLLCAILFMIVLARIQRITKRLATLEQVSQQLLSVAPTTITEAQLVSSIEQLQPSAKSTANKKIQPVWLFEQTLHHLLEMQRVQLFGLNQLSQDYQQLQYKTATQLSENSTFQNRLMHEFKASLNKIQSGIRLLHNQYISQEQKDALDIIEVGQQNMSIKLNQIIQFQRLEKGQIGIQFEQINPTQLLEQVLDIYQLIAANKGLTLTLQTQHTEYFLEGDRQKIMSIIATLVDNAVQFTEKGGITVTSQLIHLAETLRWQVAVTDTGVGIAEAYLSQIFEPFFQVNPDTSTNLTLDNGLGEMDLSLAAKVSELLGGSIEVQSELGKGSTFTFTIKLDEWHKHFERQLLKDKTLAVFYQDTTFMPFIERLRHAGATIKAFNDKALLLNELVTQTVDSVLISPDIGLSLLKTLVESIREQETTHRALIIAYYNTQNTPNTEILHAIGVDYCERYDSEVQQTEQLIKHLMRLLN